MEKVKWALLTSHLALFPTNARGLVSAKRHARIKLIPVATPQRPEFCPIISRKISYRALQPSCGTLHWEESSIVRQKETAQQTQSMHQGADQHKNLHGTEMGGKQAAHQVLVQTVPALSARAMVLAMSRLFVNTPAASPYFVLLARRMTCAFEGFHHSKAQAPPARQ